MEVSLKQLKPLIEKNAIAFSTLDRNKPYTIAVAYVKVVGNKVVITDNYMRKAIANIKKNNNVCLAVWNKNWEKKCIGFQFSGKAKYFKSGKWKDFVRKIPENKGQPAKGAILVSVSKIKRLA